MISEQDINIYLIIVTLYPWVGLCLLYLVVCPCFLVSPFCFLQNMRNPFSTLESSAVGKWYRTQNNNDNLTRIGTLYFFVSWCNPVTCIQLLPKPDCIVIWLFWANKHCMCNTNKHKRSRGWTHFTGGEYTIRQCLWHDSSINVNKLDKVLDIQLFRLFGKVAVVSTWLDAFIVSNFFIKVSAK